MVKELTTQELLQLRDNLRDSIQELIDNFHEDTGFIVEEVNISTISAKSICGISYVQNVSVKVYTP